MATTFTVSTAAQLSSALWKAAAGDTILLAAGDYGKLSLNSIQAFGKSLSGPVTLAAADPENPPVISELRLSGAANLTFRDITFDYDFKAGDALYTRNFTVGNSTNITFDNCTFDGDTASGVSAAADGYPTGVGLVVSGSTNVRIEDSEFSGFWKGITVSNTANLQVVGNDIHTIRSDGMTIASVQTALIEGNHIHDFAISPLSGDHADMIQILTAGTTKPTTDVVIRGNTLDLGEGLPTQSIWMRNEVVDTGKAGKEMYYQRITIEDNVIVNGHSHGIALGAANGVIIRNNSVLHADGARPDGMDTTLEIPRISVASVSTNVSISQNATAGILGHTGQASWTVAKNAIVQDQNPFGAGWYGNVFVASSLQTVDGAHRFTALKGGLLDTLDAGASATLNPPVGTALDANFHMTIPVAGDQVRIFDASHSTGSQPLGTTYLWSFGDGTSATGKVVTHDFGDGGTYDVTLTVKRPDGQISRETLEVDIGGAGLVRLDDSGAFAVYADGQETLLARTAAGSEDGLQLGARRIVAAVEREDVEPMLHSRDVTIALTLEADKAGAVGEVARLHGSFVISVDAKGAVMLQATSSLGQTVKLVSAGTKVNDGAPHDIEVRLEGGRLQLWVDDKKTADTAFAGTFADTTNNDLTFGNPFSSTNFYGDITAFEVLVNDGAGSQAFADDPFTVQATLDLSAPLM